MKPRVLHPLLLIPLLPGFSGCTSAYWADRGHDAADVFTMTAGYGLGAGVKVGPASAGLGLHRECAGMRAGEFGVARSLSDERFSGGVVSHFTLVQIPMLLLSPGAVGMVPSVQTFNGWGDSNFGYKVEYGDFRGKRFSETSVLVFFTGDTGGEHWYGGYKRPIRDSRWTQFEATVGAGPSVSLGFNPGELADFFLGWAGVDIYSDDIVAYPDRIPPRKDSDKKTKASP